MADILDQVMEFLKLHPEQAQTFFDKLREAADRAGPAFARAAGGLKGITQAVQELAPEVVEKFQQSKRQVEAFVEALGMGQQETGGLLNASAAIFVAWRSQLKPDAFNAITTSAQGFNTNLVDIANNLGKITKVLPGFVGSPLEKIATMGSQYASIAQPARDFESGLIAAASASGELGDILAEVGDDMSGLTDKTVKFTELTYEVAQASGRSVTEVGKYAAELMKLPGALSTTLNLTADGTEQMHLLDAAMKVAAGTGQTFEQVFEELNRQYMQLGAAGKTPEEAFKNTLEYISRLSSASQSLKMPLQFVRDYANQTAEAFKFFGNNSNAAINILARFGPALKESGLGPKAIQELTQHVTEGIGQLGMAQRAFVSQTAGGIGGLQGSFQIELLKKQGRLDEVQKLVETSLRRQFGGRVVTLEEGAKDSRAAAQLAKQVQLLTTGPTKIAGSEAEAYRILDVMAKGGAVTPETVVKPAEEALQSAVEKGNTFQERQYNSLTMLNNLAEKEVMFAAISANNLTRLVTGKDSPLVKRFISEERATATEKAATAKMITGAGPEAETKDFAAAYKDHYKDIERMADSAKNSVEKGIEEIYAKHQMMQKRQIESMAKPSVVKMPETTVPAPISMAPREFGMMKTTEMALKAAQTDTTLRSPRRQVADVLSEPEAKKILTGPMATKGANEALITVAVTCQNCNAKVAEETSVRIVDSKIASVKKGDILQPFTGSNLG